MNLKLSIFFVILVFVTFLANANSVFSYQGFPSSYFGNDVYGLGMGSTGMGDLFRVSTNYQNPSMLCSADKVIYSTAVRMGYQWYQDDQGGFRDDALNFPYFTIAIPLSKHRIGFQYHSYMNGNLENEKTIDWSDSEDDVYTYDEINKYSSNIYKASFLYAYRNKFLNVGVAANFFLGHQIHFWEMDFENTLLEDSKYEIEQTYKNAGFSIGFSKKWNSLSFGFSYQNPVTLKGDVIYRYNFTPGTDELQTDDDLFELPATYSFGMSYKITNKIRFAIETHYEEWSNTESYTNSDDCYKLGSGVSYNPVAGFGKWYERIPLRVGYYYRTLPFESNLSTIEEKAVTGGFSIPLVSPGKQLDFGFEYILRGNLEEQKKRDKIIQFSIGINGFDIFSKRHKKIEPREIPEADF